MLARASTDRPLVLRSGRPPARVSARVRQRRCGAARKCPIQGDRGQRRCESLMIRLIGVDPGLRYTGWGVIEADGNRLRHVADGVIATDNSHSVPERLKILHDSL